MINIKNKRIVVTGAGKGIGRETAILFASLGAKLALIARTQEDFDTLREKIGDSHIFFVGDVSKKEDIKVFMNKVVSDYGGIDILINNAGMRFRRPFLETTDEEWERVMDTNLNSIFHFCKIALPYMVEQRYGRIINISSIVGQNGFSDLSGYATSKAAIEGLTKSLAVEFAKYNININAIAPGFCNTSYAEKFKTNKELYDFTLDRTPLGRWGESEDIAKACVFLSSDMSNFVTGEVLNVDGGWNAC